MHRWLVWTLGAMFSWGVWALLGRLVGDALSAVLTQALSTIGILPVMLVLGFSKRLASTGHRRRGVLFAISAGILTCLGNIAYYEVLNRGPNAATVIPLTALYPVVTVLLAMVILKERLNLVQLIGVCLSLAAIYFFNVQKEKDFFSSWLLLAFIPIGLWGIAGLLQKLSTNDISGELSTQWFLGAFMPVAAYILLKHSSLAGIAPRTWLLVVGLGFTFALGNFALLEAFASNGKASIIAPLASLYPVVSLPMAILWLLERIAWRETLGIVLALIAVAALSWESRAVEVEVPNMKKQVQP